MMKMFSSLSVTKTNMDFYLFVTVLLFCVSRYISATGPPVFMTNHIGSKVYQSSKEVSKSENWDYMVFAQQWPQSVCVDSEITHQHHCKIFQNVSTWVVHGVWPTKDGSMGPNYCNKTAKFNPTKLQSIEPYLMQYWPNLYTEEPLFQFWEHEWTKHGTCAMELAIMGDELKYFSTGLKLNKQFDLLTLLEKQGLSPKDASTYQYFEVLARVEKAIGKKVKLECTLDKAHKLQYLMQVEICINKDFQPIDCGKSSFARDSLGQTNIIGCLDNYPIAYTPISH